MIILLAILASWPSEWYQAYSQLNWSAMDSVSAMYGDSAVDLAVKAVSQFGAGYGDPIALAEQAVLLDSTDYRTWTALAFVGMEQDSVAMESLFVTAFNLVDGIDPVLSEAYGYWLLSMGNSTQAVIHSKVSLSVDSMFGPAWLTLSMALVDLGKIDEALSLTEQAANRFPECSSILCQYGEVLEQAGDTQEAIGVYRYVIDLDPLMISAYSSLGLLYENSKRNGEAIKVYRSILQVRPEYGWAWSRLASCFLIEGRVDLADSSFSRALEYTQDDSWSLLQLAKLRMREEPSFSRELLEQAVLIDPDYQQAWQELAFLYESEDNLQAAEAALRRCIDLDSQAWLYGELGWVLENRAMYREAAEAYEKSLSIDDQYLYGWQRRGNIYYINGDSHDAALWYSEALAALDQQDSWIWGELGSIAVEEMLIDSAAACFSAAVAVDEEYSRGWLDLARVHRIKGELEEAKVSFDKYLFLSGDSAVAFAEQLLLQDVSGEGIGLPEDSMLNRWPDAWVSAGWSAYYSHFAQLSGEFAERAFQVKSEDPWQMINLGKLFGTLGNTQRQSQCYQLALQNGTDDYQIAVQVADFYYDQDMTDEAIQLLNETYAMFPWSEGLATALAEAYLFSDQLEEAAELLLEVVKQNPVSVYAICYLGLIEENRGNPSGALDRYLEALRIEPGYPYAEDRLRYISSDSYNSESQRSRARSFNWSVWLDLSSTGGNTDEQHYGGGGNASFDYGTMGSSVSLEVNLHSEIKDRRDIRKTAWASVSTEHFLTDHLYAGASSSWDRQPITVRPWQVSSYLAAGWKSWPASWIWFAPEAGAGLVNTKWSTRQGRTNELTAFVSLSTWASSLRPWLPSLWLSGSVYLPPGNTDLLVADAVGEIEFNMTERISLVLGTSLNYTRTPVVESWKKLDSEVYIRLRFQ